MQPRQLFPLSERTDIETQTLIAAMTKFITIAISVGFLIVIMPDPRESRSAACSRSGTDDNNNLFEILFFLSLMAIIAIARTTPWTRFNLWSRNSQASIAATPTVIPTLRDELNTLLDDFENLDPSNQTLFVEAGLAVDEGGTIKLKFFCDVMQNIILDPVEIKVFDGRKVTTEIHEKQTIETHIASKTLLHHAVLKDITLGYFITRLDNDIYDAVEADDSKKDVHVQAFHPDTEELIEGVIPNGWIRELKQANPIAFVSRSFNLLVSPYGRILLENQPKQPAALKQQHADFLRDFRRTLSNIQIIQMSQPVMQV